MPPVGSRKDTNAQFRTLDKEAKRARGALSCAECRRLKLKCDKTVPCASCKRRGCAAICPNGSLITGQGTRFVLADTEKLHQKISEMSDRIRQLEDALAIFQSSVSSEPHPLLSRDLMKIKSSIELHAAIEEESKAQNGGIIRSKVDGETSRAGEEEGETVIDAFGTLAIRDDGAATFYGRSAGSESLLIGEKSENSPTSTNASFYSPPLNTSQNNYAPLDSPRSVVACLNASFPFSPSTLHRNSAAPIDMDYLLNFLPKWEEAWKFCQLYLEQAPWFFGAVTKKQLLEEMLPLWYFEARGLGPSGVSNGGSLSGPISSVDGQVSGHTQGYEGQVVNAASPGSYSSSSSSSCATTHAGAFHQLSSTSSMRTAHDLALLFMIFCFGALTDVNLPPAPENPVSEDFFQLTKAALVLEPVLERAPSVATVQTLSLIAIYEGICSRDGSVERTWGVFGLAVKLAQSVGLHRDCARWKLSPAEVQKRRALFWELYITDCWQSLATGRLATFSLPFVDCELPQDPDSTIAQDGSIQPSFPYWKAHFGAECVSAVVQGTLTSRAPKYTIILDLDRKVRDMDLPLYAQQTLASVLDSSLGFASLDSNSQSAGEGVDTNLGLGETMSQFMPINYRELTLLYIHRCFFAHAIETNPADPMKSQYAPSFLAGYKSACTILRSVKRQFMLFPRQIARFWVLWTHAFSATVMLSSVATHVSKQSQVAHAAMIELDNACDLFEHAARYGGRAAKFLSILARLQRKAQKSFDDYSRGLSPNISNDVMKPSKADEEKDELEIFGGKTHTVATRSPVVLQNGGLRRIASTGSLIPPLRGNSGSPRTNSNVQQHLQVPGKGSSFLPHILGGLPPNHDVYGGLTSQQAQQQQQSITQHHQSVQYPSFKGVHPSLMNEMHTFNGEIEMQVTQAAMDTSVPPLPQRQEVPRETGYEHCGINNMVRENGERRQMEMENGLDCVEYQQQRKIEYQREMDYHQQQQHMQLEYQQMQQMELERSREEEEGRRVELERQEREYERCQQMQQYQVPPPPQASYPISQAPQAQYNGCCSQEKPLSPPQVRSRRSSLNLRQYPDGHDTVYHPTQPAPPQVVDYQLQPQTAMHGPTLHVVLPQQYLDSRETVTMSSSSGEQTPVTPYDVPPIGASQVSYVAQSHQVSLEPHEQQQMYTPETYSQYWVAAPSVLAQSYAPQQQQQQQQRHQQQALRYPESQYQGQHQGQHQGQQQDQVHLRQESQHQPFTPGIALRDIAADDSQLQNTWATYMYNVVSPRPFHGD